MRPERTSNAAARARRTAQVSRESRLFFVSGTGWEVVLILFDAPCGSIVVVVVNWIYWDLNPAFSDANAATGTWIVGTTRY
jgi:hypothetical protein